MNGDRAAILSQRQALQKKYGALFSVVSDLLFEADLQGINFGSNTDEYDSEAGTITPRLELARSEHEVAAIIYEEFCRWFGPQDVASRVTYEPVAKKVWEAWCAFKERDA